MYAIQKKDNETGNWRNVYNRPFGAEEAKKEINIQRKWAKEGDTGEVFRLRKVVLG